MTRMTIRLPESLHEILQQQANREGLSLNQFILYSLTRQSAFAHSIESIPAEQALERQSRFYVLLQSLGEALSDAEWDTFLQNREGKTTQNNVPEVIEHKLRYKIAARKSTL